MDYTLVAQEDFNEEQEIFVDEFRRSINLISNQTNIIMGAKDIDSRHLIATDAYAKIVALQKGVEVIDRFDREMPCEGTAQFADCYVREDQGLLHGGVIDKSISILNVHEYGDGDKARVFEKHLLKHHPTRAILGTIYSAYEIKLDSFFSIIPNYFLEFGAGCSLEKNEGALLLDTFNLTEYEHEVCFLLIMNWSFAQIASFMNKHRPRALPRVADTISKVRSRVCVKLGIQNDSLFALRDKLISLGVHRKIPEAFFKRLIGSRPLGV